LISGVAFTTLAYPELDLAGVVERYRRYGFDSLELRVADDGKHLRPAYPIPKEAREILEGVNVCSIAGYARFAYKSREELERNIDLAKRLIMIAGDLGAKGVRIYVGVFEGDPSTVITRAAEAINSLADFAEGHGVSLMVETHDTVAILDNLRILVSKLDPRVKILYDPANVIAAGGDHESVFPVIRDRVFHVHLKDFTWAGGKRVYTMPGEGVVPLDRILESLLSSGYRGYISIEWERMWHPDLVSGDIALPRYLEYVRRILRR